MNKNIVNKWEVVGFDYDRAIDIISVIEKTCRKAVSKKFRIVLN